MRFITADTLYIGDGQVVDQGVLVLSAANEVLDIFHSRTDLRIPQEKLEVFSGAICPGFVNAHCHLELSHLKGKLLLASGLPAFIKGVAKHRKVNPEQEQLAMQQADESMLKEGIVLVGDISNSAVSLDVKKNSRINYHSYVEVFGLKKEDAAQKLFQAEVVLSEFQQHGLSASLSPHAPYSLSDNLRKLLGRTYQNKRVSATMHNQEDASEDAFFKDGTGSLRETFKEIGFPLDGIKLTGLSSLRSTMKDVAPNGPLTLVHNSYTEIEDIEWAINQHKELFWCSCPSANLYINLRVPKVSGWIKAGATVCLGTDSLASNNQLSILQEMKLTQMRCPSISNANIIAMATFNGAKALQMDHKFGRLKKGTAPGVLLLKKIGSNKNLISHRTTVERLA